MSCALSVLIGFFLLRRHVEFLLPGFCVVPVFNFGHGDPSMQPKALRPSGNKCLKGVRVGSGLGGQGWTGWACGGTDRGSHNGIHTDTHTASCMRTCLKCTPRMETKGACACLREPVRRNSTDPQNIFLAGGIRVPLHSLARSPFSTIARSICP